MAMPTAAAAGFHAAQEQEVKIVGKAWAAVFAGLWVFRYSRTKCRGDSCSCLKLQTGLQQLLGTVAQLRPKLDTLTQLQVHFLLPTYYSYIPDCPHAAATRLAIADTYYK
jgi:hypothetical protein